MFVQNSIKKLVVFVMCFVMAFSSLQLPARVYAEDVQPESVEEVVETMEETSEEEGVVEEPVEENTKTEEVTLVEETTQEATLVEEATQEVIHTGPVVETLSAFHEQATIDDITIFVDAEEGVFPSGATLSVEKVLNTNTLSENNVVESYSFDIKVLGTDGNEIQPNGVVSVSFEFAQISENLDVEVFHEEEAIESTVEDNVVTVETEGFSTYTVEFTYNGKQYVLEGDTAVRLDEVLSSIGLTGEVSSYEVSNPELFNVYVGDLDGVEYVENYENNELVEYYPINKEGGDVLYLVSLQPFTTTEWLKVTIDGVEYEIVVTDAIRVDENGDQVGTNVRFMQESTAIGTITDSRVIQGPLEDNFTASMPLAEIYIDDTIVNQTLWSKDEFNGTRVIAELLVDNTQGKYAGFQINTDTSAVSTEKGVLQNSYGGVWYDFTKRYLNDTQTLTVSGSSANNYELFSGDIVRYTLKGMATKFDVASNAYKNYDVVITYSDILITLCQGSGTGSVNQANISSILRLIDTNMVNFTWSGGFRAGLSYNVNAKVVDPDTGALIDGSYYYPMTDLDIGRTGIGGFANLYNASNLNRYSEQVALMSNYGRPTSSGSWEQMVWIPGGNYSAAPFTNKANVTEDNYPYTCNITSKTIDGQANTLLISPGGTTTAVSGRITTASGVDKDNTFYSGFITLANNTAGGINVKGYASAPTSGGVESYVLTGSQIVNHKVDASSDVGGTIFTTTTGNSDGSLSGGTLLGYNEVNKPFEISAATGQSVTYTMTPKGGYKLKRVWVKDGDIDIMTIVNNAKNTVSESAYDLDGDGELNENERAAYELEVQTAIDNALASDTTTSEIPISSLTSLGKGVYTYSFNGIKVDKSIHIDWEKTDLTVTKNLNPNVPGATDKFKFQIKLTDTSTQETTWRVRAKKNTGKFEWNASVENGTSYYMAYYEWKDETVPYKYVEVEDTTDKNPSEEGWYYEAGGAYYPSTDTEPKPGVTYYIKDDTQTSTIRNHHYHILGWNETTQSWDDYTVTGGNEIVSGSDLGPVNLDTDLADNYRFVYDGDYVYPETSHDASTDTYGDYLMWIQDDTTGEEILVVGNSETYPQGRKFIPAESADSDYVYVFRDGVADYSGKVVQAYNSQTIGGETYPKNGAGNKYQYTEDTTTPIYYDLVSNPNGYNLNSGYSEVTGESGVYIVTLPAGQRPITDGLTADGWDVSVSRVGAISDTFDLGAAMVAAGAKSVAGAVNTFEFELQPGETIDFNGVVPMGYQYEITEILPQNSKWKLVSSSSNKTVNDFDGEEAVTFTNAEKLYDITIEKQTISSKPATFGFTISIFRENITPAQNQSIMIQAYKNSGDAVPNYKLTNSGAPIDLEMNGKIVTIPTGESYHNAGGQMAAVIEDLIAMDSTATNPITMNQLSGEVAAVTDTSIADQVQALIDEGYTSFSLEPIEFKLSTQEIVERIPYNPTTVPAGFNGSNGVFTFTLTNNDSKNFPNIPYGYKYEISETTLPAGWENTSKSNEKGTLTGDNYHIYSLWKNDLAKLDLTIEKETVDNMPGEFVFHVQVYYDFAENEHPTYPQQHRDYIDLSTIDGFTQVMEGNVTHLGEYKITLANGESVTIPDIPYGYSYSVVEQSQEGWKLASPSSPTQTGTLTSDKVLTYVNDNHYNLTLKKETINNEAGTFNFEVKISGWKTIYKDKITDIYYQNVRVENANNRNEQLMLDVLTPYLSRKVYNHTRVEWGDNETIDFDFRFRKDGQEVPGTFQDVQIGTYRVSLGTRIWDDGGGVFDIYPSILGGNGVEGSYYMDWSGAEYASVEVLDYLDLSSFGGTENNDGSYSFTMSNDESKVITGIPYGYSYEVYEVDAEGNKVLVGGNIGSTPWKLKSITGNNTGTISDDTSVTFTNEKLADLTVTKKTKDNISGTFNYMIKFWNESKTTSSNSITVNVDFVSLNSGQPVTLSSDASAYEYRDNELVYRLYKGDDISTATLVETSSAFPGEGWTYDSESNRFSYVFTNVEERKSYLVETSTEPGVQLDLTINGSDTHIDCPFNWDENIMDYEQVKAASPNGTVSFTHEVSGTNVSALPQNNALEGLADLFNVTKVYADDTNATTTPYDPDSADLPTGCNISKTAPGEYSFTLTNNQSVTFKDLPHGVHYEVYEETEDGWKLVDINGASPTVSKGAGGTSGTLTEDKEDVFNNIPLYDITVDKSVTGVKGDKNKDFNFTLELWNEKESTQPSGQTVKVPYNLETIPQGVTKTSDGVYTFALKDSQNKIFEDIPYGVQYKITEDDYSSEMYITHVDGANTRIVTGTVDKDKTHHYVNDKDIVDLKITKKVAGNMGNKSEEFTFKVRVHGWREVYTDQISELHEFINPYTGENYGIYQVDLKNVENNQRNLDAVLRNLQIGDYVDTHVWADHTTEVWGYGSLYTVGDGCIHNDDGVHYEASGRGLYSNINAESSANIKGLDDSNKLLTLEVYEYLNLTEYGGTAVDENGDGYVDYYTFTLSHDDTLTIPNIPVGYEYEVEEVDYSNEGYTTTVDGNEGRSVSGELTEDKAHTFKNYRSAVVPTEIRTRTIYAGVVVSILAVIVFILREKYRKIGNRP